MKRNAMLIVVALLAVVACQSDKKPGETVETAAAEYDSFGEQITDDKAAPVAELVNMSSDSAYTKVKGKIVEVCQAKGCWMTLDLGNNETMRVTFKDYGFFVPKDSKGKEVVIEGVALRTMTPVEELKHYATDAGKPDEEIAAITEPRQELTFEAVGVLLR